MSICTFLKAGGVGVCVRERDRENGAIQWQPFPSGEIDEVQWPLGQGSSGPLLGLLPGPLNTTQDTSLNLLPTHTHTHTELWYWTTEGLDAEKEMVAMLALVLMAGTGRFEFQPLLRGPDADMLLHYVSLCFIWLCLVKRGGVGVGWRLGDVVQMSGRVSPAQTLAGQQPSVPHANCFIPSVRRENKTKKQQMRMHVVDVAALLGLAASNTLLGSGS